MFVNRFARAFSLHDVLGDIEGLGSSAVSNGVSQSVFHEERARLATFKDWPHSSPSASTLAKAGFIFVPTTSYYDQCKCFACLKLFSDWEPGDDPWSCHRTNSPLCAFVCSIVDSDRVSDAPACSSDVLGTSHLVVSEVPDDSVSHLDISSTDSATALLAQSASSVPTSSGNASCELAPFAAAVGDGGDVLVSRIRIGGKTKVDRKKNSRVVEASPPNDEQQRAQQELLQIRFLVASSRHAAQQYWDQVAADVAVKVDHISERLNLVSDRVCRLRGHDWLFGKREELQSLQQQIFRLTSERSDLEAGNRVLSAKLDDCRDAASKLRELTVEVHELEHRKASAIASCRQLEDQIAACLIRIEAASSEADALLRDGRKEQEQLVARNKLLHSENLHCNEAIHDLNHTIARRRQELQVYEVKLKDWSRREEIALELERSLMQREAIVAATEKSLQARIASLNAAESGYASPKDKSPQDLAASSSLSMQVPTPSMKRSPVSKIKGPFSAPARSLADPLAGNLRLRSLDDDE